MATGDNYIIKNDIGEIDWSRLTPGSVVSIPARPDPTNNTPTLPYRSRFVIGNSGISVVGVPHANGQKPVISGENCTTHPQFKLQNDGFDSLGLVMICPTIASGLKVIPSDIVIENLILTSANIDRDVKTFGYANGTIGEFSRAVAALYLMTSHNVTVRGCDLLDCGNGLFAGDSQPNSDLLVDRCKFAGNGKIGSDRQHQTYISGSNITITNCIYDAMREGANGGQIKTRPANLKLIGNRVRTNGRTIDISAWENSVDARLAIEDKFKIVIRDNVLINPYGQPFIYAEDLLANVANRSDYGDIRNDIDFSNNVCILRVDQSTKYYTVLISITDAVKITTSKNIWDIDSATIGAKTSEVRAFGNGGVGVFGDDYSSIPLYDYGMIPTIGRQVTGLYVWDALTKKPSTIGAQKVVAGPVGYKDADNGDYTLRQDSPALGYGLTSVPVPPPVVPPPPPSPPIPVPTISWIPVTEWIGQESNGYRHRNILEKKVEN